MLIGYVRVSKSDGSQSVDLQKDALIESGVIPSKIYQEYASGKKEDRPELASCLKSLRDNEDILVIWKLDRLGRDLKHLVNIVDELSARGIGLKVLTGKGANIDTSTSAGKMFFGFFAVIAEYERDLMSERTVAGLKAARARGRYGGRPYKMTKAKLRLAMASMNKPEIKINDLCKELEISRQTLYRHVSPQGELRKDGEKLLYTK